MRRQASLFLDWYNGHRPHTTLGGVTPDEIYFCATVRNNTPRTGSKNRFASVTALDSSSQTWPKTSIRPGERSLS